MLYVNTTLLEMKILFGLIVGILLHPHPFLPQTVCRNDTGTHKQMQWSCTVYTSVILVYHKRTTCTVHCTVYASDWATTAT